MKESYEISVWEDTPVKQLNCYTTHAPSDRESGQEEMGYAPISVNDTLYIPAELIQRIWDLWHTITDGGSSYQLDGILYFYTPSDNTYLYYQDWFAYTVESGNWGDTKSTINIAWDNTHTLTIPSDAALTSISGLGNDAYFEESKLFVIGSDTMESPWRALSPKMVDNINGTHTFTFQMVEYNGDPNIKNPYLPYLFNERKIKVKWGDEWYDLVINNCQYDNTNRVYTFTCIDLAISELSKSGFNVILDSELGNNVGTAHELATTVLEDSGWIFDYDPTDPDQYFQQIESEPVYETVFHNGPITVEPLEAEARSHLETNDKVFLFYESIQEALNTIPLDYDWPTTGSDANLYTSPDGEWRWFQGLAPKEGASQAPTVDVDVDGHTILNYKNIRMGPCQWSYNRFNQTFTIIFASWGFSIDINRVSDVYKGNRIIISPLTVFDINTNKYCNVYKAVNTVTSDINGQVVTLAETDDILYGYSQTEFTSPSTIQDLMINGSNWTNLTGWEIPSNTSDRYAMTQWRTYTSSPSSPSESYSALYVHVNSGSSDSDYLHLRNDLFHQRLDQFPHGFAVGDQYIFRWRCLENPANSTEIFRGVSVQPYILSYEYSTNTTDYLFNFASSIHYFSRSNVEWDSSGKWMWYKLTCIKSLSYEQLRDRNVGLFLYVRPVIGDNFTPYSYLPIGATQFFPYIPTNTPLGFVEPDSLNTNIAFNHFYYYNKSDWSASKNILAPIEEQTVGESLAWEGEGKEQHFTSGEHGYDVEGDGYYSFDDDLNKLYVEHLPTDLESLASGTGHLLYSPLQLNTISTSNKWYLYYSNERRHSGSVTQASAFNAQILNYDPNVNAYQDRYEYDGLDDRIMLTSVPPFLLQVGDVIICKGDGESNYYTTAITTTIDDQTFKAAMGTYGARYGTITFVGFHQKVPFQDAEWSNILTNIEDIKNTDYKFNTCELSTTSSGVGKFSYGVSSAVDTTQLILSTYSNSYGQYEATDLVWAENAYITTEWKTSPTDIEQIDGYCNTMSGNSLNITLNSAPASNATCLAVHLKHGLFIKFDYNNWIKDIQFGKIPSTVNANKPAALYEFFHSTQEQSGVAYIYHGTQDWPRVDTAIWSETGEVKDIQLQTTDELINTVSAKQSNRYNILQSIAEKFKCYVQFEIVHDALGRIIYDDNGQAQKYVRLKKTIGHDTGLSFVYGLDLKTIKRTDKSDQLVTKTIVLTNVNEFAKDGFCTIERSKFNPARTNYILNFDYYIDQGLLDYKTLIRDLYGADNNGLGYYYWLNQYYRQYDEATTRLTGKTTELNNKKALISTYQKTIESCTNEMATIRSEIYGIDPATSWPPTASGVIHEKYQGYLATEQQLANCRKLINDVLPLISQYEAEIDQANTDQESALALINEKTTQFNRKYLHYIREGTYQSSDFVDDDRYYLEAKQVAATSARPQVTYDLSVIRLSALDEFKNKVFKVGDVAYIEDPEYFGYEIKDGIKTPRKEKVMISEITSNFDEPEKDTIKIQNYKTQFEELFQRLVATTQSLQYAKSPNERNKRPVN